MGVLHSSRVAVVGSAAAAEANSLLCSFLVCCLVVAKHMDLFWQQYRFQSNKSHKRRRCSRAIQAGRFPFELICTMATSVNLLLEICSLSSLCVLRTRLSAH